MPKRLTDAETAALDSKATRTVGWALMVPGGLILTGCIAAVVQLGSWRVLGCALLIGLPLFLAGAQRVFFPRAFKNEGRRDLD
ncbi:MAG: hypothetical protein QM723_30125 [Myxococcaceae bacterium]